jgi:hypothetical protein
MQIAGIRSVLNGRTIRPDVTAGREAEAAPPARDAAAPARSAAIVPLPASPARAGTTRPLAVAFPTANDAAAATRPIPDAQRAYRDMQNTAAPRAVLALVDDVAAEAAPARAAARTARGGPPAADEAAADAPRPGPSAMPPTLPGAVAHGLAALWRLAAGQVLSSQGGLAGEDRRRATGKATAAAADKVRETAGEGGWTEALTLFTLVATVCLALWLLVF